MTSLTYTSLFILIPLMLAACQPALTPEQLCTQTVKDYAVLRDNGPAESYADIFENDATFTIGRIVTQGRTALIARHKLVNSNALWRHNMTDIRINTSGPHIVGHSRFIVRTGPHPAPSYVERHIIGHYDDIFKMSGDQCRIQSRAVHILFDSQNLE